MLSCLALAVVAANACSSDAGGTGDGADAALADASQASDGAAALDSASPDDATDEPPAQDAGDAGTSTDAAKASDAGAGATWRTVLGATFNTNDVVTTPAGVAYVIGARAVGGVLRGVVVRILPGGLVDTTFGASGFADVVLSSSFPNQPLRAVVQPNGQLVLLGVVYGTPWSLAITRLDATGAVDTTFGSSGLTKAHVGIGNDLPFGIALRPSGGFVFTGMAFGATNFASEAVVGRVDANGALDTTFDGDGLVVSKLGGTNQGRGVGVDSLSRVLVAVQSDNVSDVVLLRYTAAGAPDATFSNGQDAGSLPPGAAVVRFAASSSSSPEGMRQDASGKWVIYGTGQVPGPDAGSTRSTMLAARVNEDGVVDATFHNGGGPYYPTPVGKSFAYSFASQPSGKALMAGAVYEGPQAPFDSTKYWPAIVALDTAGNRDYAAFGIFTGLQIPHVYPGSDAIVAALPNGRFVAVASTATSVEVLELAP